MIVGKPVKKLSRSLTEPNNYDHGNSQSSTNISRKKITYKESILLEEKEILL